MHPDIAPSWSWAVIGHGERTHANIYEYIYAHQRYINSPNEVELIDISVNNLGDNNFSQVISGGITLRGLCHPLKELLETNNFYFQFGWHAHAFEIYSKDQNYQPFSTDRPPLEAMRLHMDTMDGSKAMFWQRPDVHIIRVGMFSSYLDSNTGPSLPRVEATSFLILEEVPTLEDSYRRIGIARILGSGIESSDWKTKTVTIL
jgi:hypothetical protein